MNECHVWDFRLTHRCRQFGRLATFIGAIAWLALPEASAQEIAPPVQARSADKASDQTGLAALVEVKLPLGSGAEAPLKQTLTRARDKLVAAARQRGDGRRPILVLRFIPDGGAEGAGSQFETVLSLARFLSSQEMSDVKTVAWIPRTIRGHGVLAVIACEEIVAGVDAEFGAAGVDEPKDAGVSRVVVEAYREIADGKRTVPVAIAVGMIDPAVEIVQVESEEGLRFLLRDEVDEFRDENEVISEETLSPAGSLASFTGRQGRQFGFVKYLADDKAAVAKALSVPADSLEVDQSLHADWQPVMITIRGEITPDAVGQLSTLLGHNLESGANWIGVRIDSVGGDLSASLELANQIASLDSNSVRTVAYVPVEAKGGAALIALACDQLVMHPAATIGIGPNLAELGRQDNRDLPPPKPPGPAFQVLDEAAADLNVDIAAAKASIRDSLAAKTDRGWGLLAATIDPNVEVFQYRNKQTGDQRWMSVDEARQLRDGVNWAQGAPLHGQDEIFALNGTEALQADIAYQTVDSFDQLERLYGISDVELVEPNWAMKLVHSLASPALATFLLMLGMVGLYIELKTPGVGVGGVVAAIAFLLFFWSKSLEGTATSLEIVMFVGGVILMLIEIFVVPGVGVLGLAGGMMVIFSLVLASQTFSFPRSAAQMDEMRQSITIVAGAGLGVIGLAIALRSYLPKAPVFNRLVLEPPPPEERVTLSHREAMADYSHLIGVVGEAATDLRPGGRALVGGQLIDVIADGMPIDRGTSVVVVEVHATRVLVRESV